MSNIGRSGMNMADHSMPGHDMPGHNMPGHDMPKMCKMNMLFTWEYEDVCVVFKWWHIHNMFHLVLSILAIVILAAGYELLKFRYRVFTKSNLASYKGLPTNNAPGNVYWNRLPKNFKWKQAIYYGLQVGYSFMLMLIFMSFNGWLMLAVVVGATFGHFLWNNVGAPEVVYGGDGSVNQSQESIDGEPLACH